MCGYFVLKGRSILINIDLPNVGDTLYSYMDSVSHIVVCFIIQAYEENFTTSCHDVGIHGVSEGCSTIHPGA